MSQLKRKSIRWEVAGLVIIAGTFVLTFLFCAKQLTTVEEERAQLIGGIESYQSSEEFFGYLRERGHTWEVTHERETGGLGRLVPYTWLDIEVRPYEHLGFAGKLSVTFFNDRLMETRFYPEKSRDYLAVLNEQLDLGIQKDHRGDETINIHKPGNLHIWVGLGQSPVVWSDRRLEGQDMIWGFIYD